MDDTGVRGGGPVGSVRLRAGADDVRAQAWRIRGAGSVDWRSSAAMAFRSELHEVGLACLDLALRLDEAADVLDRHVRVAADRLVEVEEFLRRLPGPWPLP